MATWTTTWAAVLRSVVGFGVGFGAALAIIVATEIGRSPTGSVVEVVGIPDVFEYCRSGSLELAAALRPDGAEDWRCVGVRDGTWDSDPIDFDEACRTQFGSHTVARTVDSASSYAWRCVSDG